MSHQQLKCFILFEATLQSIDMIKDEEKKKEIKNYFNIWYKNGIKYWKELEKVISISEETQTAYEELSAALYETSSKLIETERTSELLVELQTLLKKY
jgi:hypothetical protein